MSLYGLSVGLGLASHYSQYSRLLLSLSTAVFRDVEILSWSPDTLTPTSAICQKNDASLQSSPWHVTTAQLANKFPNIWCIDNIIVPMLGKISTDLILLQLALSLHSRDIWKLQLFVLTKSTVSKQPRILVKCQIMNDLEWKLLCLKYISF